VDQYISRSVVGIFSTEPTFASTVVLGEEFVVTDTLFGESEKFFVNSVPSKTLVDVSALSGVEERTGAKARDVKTWLFKLKPKFRFKFKVSKFRVLICDCKSETKLSVE
jgi:hypothetical protein